MGANSLAYQFGYGDYYNPYYVETPVVNYAEPVVTMPIETASQEGTPYPPGVSQDAVSKFDQVRAAFLARDYDKVLKLTDEAVAQMPHDAVLHEFRSLVLFALRRYPEAAAAIHAVLAVGPGWDAKTLTSLYPDMDTYTAHCAPGSGPQPKPEGCGHPLPPRVPLPHVRLRGGRPARIPPGDGAQAGRRGHRLAGRHPFPPRRRTNPGRGRAGPQTDPGG